VNTHIQDRNFSFACKELWAKVLSGTRVFK